MKINSNDIKVLKLIQLDICTSQVELAKTLNLSEAAISKKVKKLLEYKFLKVNFEKNKKTFGRNSRGLEINLDLGNILGGYFSHDNIFLSISDLKGKVIHSLTISLKSKKNIEELFYKELDIIIKSYNILCIGLGMNGIVDNNKGVSIYSASYNWNNKPLKINIEKRYKIPVFIENGVNLILLYEKRYILDNTINNFLVINLGKGVGGGLFLNNQIYQGKYYDIGEIGHIPFDFSPYADICNCGGKGCLETLISDIAIEKKVFKETNIDYKIDEIIIRANKGEVYFKNILLGLIPIFINIIFWSNSLISPQKIIFYGKLNKYGDFFWKELNRRITEGNLNKINKLVIEKRRYSTEIVVQGAILLALDNIFYKILREEI